MVVALIAAGGKGIRMKNKITNKLFIEIENKPILFYTLKKFDMCSLVDEICLVLDKESMKEKIEEVKEFGIKKLKKIIEGGKTRGESVYNGLKALDKDTKLVVIHDGARPFISLNKIREIIHIVKDTETEGAVLAIPLSDTLKKIEGIFITETIPREEYVRVQTPQVFKYNTILKAYEDIGKKEGFINTDEAYLLEKAGYKVRFIEGEDKNIKITTPFDLNLAKLIIKEDGAWSI